MSTSQNLAITSLVIGAFFGLSQIATAGSPTVPTAAVPVQRVMVINSASKPVPVIDVDNPARQPFQQHFNFSFDPTQGSNGRSFTVPAGKRLVIEFVSATVGLEMGSLVDAAVVTTVDGIEAAHHMVPTSVGAAWGLPLSYLISKDMRVYADPETTVTIAVTDNLTGNGVMDASISGYLIDLP